MIPVVMKAFVLLDDRPLNELSTSRVFRHTFFAYHKLWGLRSLEFLRKIIKHRVSEQLRLSRKLNFKLLNLYIMLLLRNNKIVNIDVSEDMFKDNDFKAIRTLEMLKADGNRHASKDEIYEMCVDSSGNFNFKCIQSCYSDDSSLGKYITSRATKGELVHSTIGYGYKVFNGEIEITL